jgi:signal transduction histidine kinase
MNREKKDLILIVDDATENLHILSELLEAKYDLKVSLSGETALNYAFTEPHPDLILLDIAMPEMDGFETCKRLKANPDTKDIPVIFLTALNHPDDILRGFDEGAVDYVCKPFQPKELLKRIHTQLELQHRRQREIEENKIRQELLHVLSHDLSNSLGAISSFAEIILEDQENSGEYAEYIQSAIQASLNIVEQSRHMCAADKKDLKLSSIPLKSAALDAQFLLQAKLRDKNISMEIDIPEQLTVLAEEVSLTNSVINNLLTNAIKFSNPGSVIHLRTVEIDEKTVKLYVRDSGIGMPEKLALDIFDITKTTSRPGTNGEQGTGFGMALVKKYMEKYRGTVSVTSKSIQDYPNDHGTIFSLTFHREQDLEL